MLEVLVTFPKGEPIIFRVPYCRVLDSGVLMLKGESNGAVTSWLFAPGYWLHAEMTEVDE